MKLVLVLIALLAAARAGWAQAPGDPRFDLLEFQVEGNTVLPAVRIERAVYPFLGEGKRVADVEQARAALEQAYRDAGYPLVLVDIPEQKVAHGVVLLRVTESRIGRVRVVGSRYYSQGWILAKAPALQEGETLYSPDLQDQLAQLNRTPGRRVTPVLRPGREPGTTDIDLRVEDRPPWHASVELNNYYSANTSPLRLTASLRYDNLFQREHTLGLQVQTSPQDTNEVLAFLATYGVPFADGRTSLAAYALSSRSNVAALGGFAVAGNGSLAGFRVNRTLPATATYSHLVSFGADYKDFDETLDSGGAGTIQTPIKYVPLALQYLGTVSGESGVTEITAGVGLGIRELFSDSNEFANKRFSAGSNFIVFRWDLRHTQDLPLGLALYARFDGQVADQPLVSNEQYFAGGARNVRGYLEAEALGDDALHGTLQLDSPSFAERIGEGLSEARALVFIEGARVRILKPLPGQVDSTTLASAGIGLRARAGKWSALALDLGWPFKGTVNTQAGNPRLQFSVTVEM